VLRATGRSHPFLDCWGVLGEGVSPVQDVRLLLVLTVWFAHPQTRYCRGLPPPPFPFPPYVVQGDEPVGGSLVRQRAWRGNERTLIFPSSP
jgi:hypothetical protein